MYQIILNGHPYNNKLYETCNEALAEARKIAGVLHFQSVSVIKLPE